MQGAVGMFRGGNGRRTGLRPTTYDVVLIGRTNRKALIERHAGAGTLVCAAHFHGESVGRIEPEGDHFRFDGVY